MAEDQVKDLIKRYVEEVLFDENYEAIEDLFTSDFDEPKPTITGGVATSLEDLKASYAEYHQRVSIRDVDFLTVQTSGEEGLAIWIAKTEYHESFGGIQPAGNPQPHQELTWIEIEDGRIDRVHHLRDSLETIPPAARAAHTSALTMVETGVIASDQAGDIVYINSVALDIVDVERDVALGSPVRDLLNQSIAHLSDGQTTEFAINNGQRIFEVTASELRDERYGMKVGQFLLLYEITARKHRVERLQVLNRVLRHNLRNDLTSITGYAELVTQAVDELPPDASRALDNIIEVGNDLAQLSQKSTFIREGLNLEERVEYDLVNLAEELVQRATERFPTVFVEIIGEDTVPVTGAISLENGLWEIVENACKYSPDEDPTVKVEVSRSHSYGLLKIIDNGPGIPEHELQVIETEEETPLQHGSGLGLWIAKWAIDASGGIISFSQNSPQGSVVTIELPLVKPNREPE